VTAESKSVDFRDPKWVRFIARRLRGLAVEYMKQARNIDPTTPCVCEECDEDDE
jgi:hypothetical protein